MIIFGIIYVHTCNVLIILFTAFIFVLFDFNVFFTLFICIDVFLVILIDLFSPEILAILLSTVK